MKTLLTVGFVLLASAAFAQTPSSYTIKYYNAGAPSPLSQTDAFPVASVACNQTPPAPGASTVNPTRAIWDDIANVGKVCIYVFPVGGALPSLPIGANYEGTITATNTAGSSAESARAPFSRLGPPSARTGLSFAQ